MWPAQRRAVESVPPDSLDALRPTRGEVALRCTMRGCTACAAFETEEQAAFERGLRSRGVADVLTWDCGDATRRRLAMGAGVDRLPAYVFVPANGTPRVTVPGQE